MGHFVIAAYRPHSGKDAELLEAVRDHLPILRREGLATDRPPLVLKAADGTILELFEWVSAEAVEKAHTNPAVLKLWERFAHVCAYEKLANLREAGELFPHFERLDLSGPAT